eukprot:2035222-Amphidinium_carterae.3
MDRDEFANIFSSFASTSVPKPKPPPPPREPPPTSGKAAPPPFHPSTAKGPPPPPPKGAAASSSSSGAQFGFDSVPKKAPPMHVKGVKTTRTKPLGETIGTTWSGC